jgi:hypothetical protein
MFCDKCKQEIILTEEVLETVIEKVKIKKEEDKEKTKRQPSLYNIFLSQYMKREDVKMHAPKIRMRLASLEWNKLKTQSSEEKKIEVNDDDEKEKRKNSVLSTIKIDDKKKLKIGVNRIKKTL